MRRRLPDLLIALLLFVLPLILFWQQTLGGRTLLPTENLYQYEPYATYREVVQAPAVPHNHLLSDLVLQNYQWKSFVLDSIAQREIPLWNPHQFSGIPFLAAGQQSAFYPLSILYYALPLPAAYGWFTVLNLWLAGVLMYAFMRGLGVARFGGLIAAVTYQLCGFFIASAVFPMITGAAAWLPLLLLMAEFIIRRQPFFGRESSVPWVAVGAGALGCNIFAGHVEMTIYTLLILAFYSAVRLGWEVFYATPPPRTFGSHPLPVDREGEPETSDGGMKVPSSPAGRGFRGGVWQDVVKPAFWLAAMVALGFGLGSIQFIPLFEFVQTNWRAERSDLWTVLRYAHPPRDLIQFGIPNFYGSPAHHSYFDIFTLETVRDFTRLDGTPINFIDWGMKNYVEGALYLGILPLALAAFAIVSVWARLTPSMGMRGKGSPPYRLIFAVLTLISVTFMFGLPTYAAVYILPGINQLNSPFRWVYGVTVGVAVLAGFGADALFRMRLTPVLIDRDGEQDETRGVARRFGIVLVTAGVLILTGLLFSRVVYGQIEPLLERIVEGMALADQAFSGARMFYSFQFTNVLIFGLMMLASGGVFLLAGRAGQTHGSAPTDAGERSRFPVPFWQAGAVALIAVDLMIASWGFNPASDPLLLDFTPPAVQWLLDRYEEEGPFRYTVINDPAQRDILKANMTMRYGLDDIRGYDSIIPADYVEYMRQTSEQNQLDHNRIAPLYVDWLDTVDWWRLAQLNVRYIVTHKTTNLADYVPQATDIRTGVPLPPIQPVYEDEAVRIWFYAPYVIVPRAYVNMVEGDLPATLDEAYYPGFDAVIEHDTGREKIIHVNVYENPDSWLIISENYAPGWRAFVRPRGGEDDTEQPLEVEQVFGYFQGANVSPAVVGALFQDQLDNLTPEEQAALNDRQYTVRMIYSPTSFQVGMFGSIISGAVVVFLAGVWLWRLLVAPDDAQGSGVSRVARNSVAPIILNLFNRGIDFAFALVMLRILGPEQAGIYFYAVVIFAWFDIFTNFGLDVFLIREVSRRREQSGYYLLNTSALRLFLMVVCVPLLVGFLMLRQAAISPPISQEGLLAIGLLYIGLAPGSLNKGITSLFYAFERAEYPAAVTTITTINKAVLGLVVLLLGYGIVGLAAVSIFINLVTMVILLWAGRGLIGKVVSLRPDRRLTTGMVNESWPLMLNHFLATVFFQIDIVILEALRGATIVGQYSVSYKWLLALNVIPAFFTQALLPVMSRQARADGDRAALRRTYTLAIKLLVIVALPLAVVFTFLAETLTFILGGSEYLPAGAIALQIMIWSIPIGWINSLTQYALIAVDLQRRITTAFVIAVSFNIITNMIFIPRYSYQAAAVTTILSEMVLLLPFGLMLQSALGRLDWRDMVWRPVMAGGVMFGVLLVGWSVQPVLALVAGSVIYPVVLLALRPFSTEEIAMVTPLLPARFRKVFSLA